MLVREALQGFFFFCACPASVAVCRCLPLFVAVCRFAVDKPCHRRYSLRKRQTPLKMERIEWQRNKSHFASRKICSPR